MDTQFILAIAPVIGLLVQIFIHLVLSRIYPGSSPWQPLFIGFSVGSILTGIFVVFSVEELTLVDSVSIMLIDMGAMLSLGFCYFTFVNLNYTSLRIRLLREFISHEGELALPDILKKYSMQIILESRLTRLVNAGELLFDGESYCSGEASRFSMIGAILEWFKRVLLIRTKAS